MVQRLRLPDRKRKITRYDPKGRSEGYFEEEDGRRRSNDSRPHTTKSIRMYDHIELDDASKVRGLDNGYLAAMPRIARTGIQEYNGDEVGMPEMDTVRVYRPESEVFSADAVHSYTHLPLTLDHPTVQVNAANWKKYAVGETGDEVLRDGTAVRVPMMLRDAEAIKAFRDGTNQLSVGYDCDLEWVSGVTDKGEEFDAIQHGIRANHLAVVAAARGGSTLVIGDGDDNDYGEDFEFNDDDQSKGVTTMNLKTILVDGLEVQVLDSAATVIQRTISSLERSVEDFHDKFKKKESDEKESKSECDKKDAALQTKDDALKAKDKEIETKTGEIESLKAQLDAAKKESAPAAIDAKARERAGVIDKANTIMGSRLKTDGMTVADIRRNVVDAKVGNCKDWSDDRVEGAFDAMQSNAFTSDHRYGHGSSVPNSVDDAVRVFGRPGGGYQSPSELRDKAYNEYDTGISDAWRSKTEQ